MARNALSNIPPRLSASDLDWIYGRDGAFPAAPAEPMRYQRPGTPGGPSLTYDQYGQPIATPGMLRGTIGPDTPIGGAPALRGTIDPSKGIPTASGAPLPVGKGFAQAVYERALGSGLTDTQARLVASQAALESNHGRSGLSRRDNNFFGIKAGSSWKGERASWGTGEQDASGRGYRTQSDFRKYASPEDSFADYARLVQRKWPEAWNAGNISDAAAGLRFGQQGGYATDQAYGSKLERISRGLKPVDLDNPTGIRPPRDIPNPMGAGPVDQPISNRATGSNFAPPQNNNDLLVGRGDLRAQPLPGNPQDYVIQRPYIAPSPERVQDYFQPLQVQQPQSFQPVQMSENALGGGGDDLVSFLGLGGDMGGWG